MKYARRSVSDQDIRRYEMFAQVIDLSHGSYVNAERVLIYVIFFSTTEFATVSLVWIDVQVP